MWQEVGLKPGMDDGVKYLHTEGLLKSIVSIRSLSQKFPVENSFVLDSWNRFSKSSKSALKLLQANLQNYA